MDGLFFLGSLVVILWFWNFPAPFPKYLVPVIIQVVNVFWILFFWMLSVCPFFDRFRLRTPILPSLSAKAPPVWQQFSLALVNNLLVSMAYFGFTFRLDTMASQQTYFFVYICHIVFETLLCYCLYEVLQTLLHRLMHLPWWFIRFHRLHHLTLAEESYTGFFMHPVDLLAQVILPTFIPTLYICTCLESVLLFFVLGISYSHAGHSGFAVPGFFSSQYHQLHHRDMTKGFAPLLEFLIEPKKKPQ